MSLGAYDQGLLDYLKSAMNFPNIINSAESKAFDNIADKNKGIEIEVPMISFWRVGNPMTLPDGGSYPSRHRGRRVRELDEVESKQTYWRSLEMTLSYQITIWSDRRKEADDIFRELLMYLTTDNPYISVNLDALEDEPQQFSLHVVDTDSVTDVDEFANTGRLYTHHIMVDIDNAQMIFNSKCPVAKDMPIRTITIEG